MAGDCFIDVIDQMCMRAWQVHVTACIASSVPRRQQSAIVIRFSAHSDKRSPACIVASILQHCTSASAPTLPD